jgi:hypothetical protein
LGLSCLDLFGPFFMSHVNIFLISIIGLFGCVPLMAFPPAPLAAALAIAWQTEPPARIENAAEEVFKRAFWRRPGAEDHILQAVRHEWHDADGVSRWQWFLIVDPSPGLLQELREKNIFSLVPGSIEAMPEVPAWFSYDSGAVEPWRSRDGRMQVAFRSTDNRIFACAGGGGFTKGTAAPSVAVPPAPVSSAGRLPNQSPPTSVPGD